MERWAEARDLLIDAVGMGPGDALRFDRWMRCAAPGARDHTRETSTEQQQRRWFWNRTHVEAEVEHRSGVRTIIYEPRVGRRIRPDGELIVTGIEETVAPHFLRHAPVADET